MSYTPPTPPTDLPDVVDALDDCSAEQLRLVARYAEELAEYREREERLTEAEDRTEVGEPTDERPEGVPSKATITVKEINDNQYYYWQWRDGENVKSQYKGPVESDR